MFSDPLVGSSELETAPAPPSRYGGVVGIAMQFLGTPYVWGGSSPGGFDCSGFVMYVYAQVGVSLPHNAAAQFGYGAPVSRDQLEPGDIVFFDGLGHNGIYIGGGQFIHSPHTGDVVKISSLCDSWYDRGFVGARASRPEPHRTPTSRGPGRSPRSPPPSVSAALTNATFRLGDARSRRRRAACLPGRHTHISLGER